MTASLGEVAASVRVRRLTQDEAFLLGALHLQGLRGRGVAPDHHVQAMGMAWHQRFEELPAWVAECEVEHVGLAVGRLPVLPLVGSGVPELIVLVPLGRELVADEPVALALVRAVVTWAGDEGYGHVDVAPDVTVPPAVLDGARATVHREGRVQLPTNP